jgi:hypothetical protein
MREMTKGNIKLKVVEHIITRNFWEYYILERERGDIVTHDPDIVYALVMGDHDEIGTVSMREINPYIFSRTVDLSDVAPAIGYRWEDKKETSDFEQFALDIE